MSIRNPAFVIPAEVGIQAFQSILDPGFRRGDGPIIGHFNSVDLYSEVSKGEHRGVSVRASISLGTSGVASAHMIHGECTHST